MRIKTAAVALAGALALGGAACGGDDPGPGGDTATPGDPTATAPDSDAGGDDGEPEPAPVAFNDAQVSGAFDCDGQDVAVNGEDADLHLVGSCGVVVINGERAQVTVDDAELIVVNGENAALTYSGDPEVTVNGEHATAEQAD